MLERTTQPQTLIEKLVQENNLTVQYTAEGQEKDGYLQGVKRCIDIVKQHSDWISVDERLPDEDGKYLVYCVGNRELTKDRKELSIMRFNQKTKGGWFALSPLFKVVYWQPIQPPSEVQDD